MTEHGPFETEQEARETPAARAVYATASAAGHPPGWRAEWDRRNRAIITGAIKAAGVTTGAYDERIVAWLAGYEPQMCASVAGLITRAYEAGKDAVGE